MPIITPNPPAELAALERWIIWRSEQRDGKPTKVPYTTMGYRASVTDPEQWSTFENACRAADRPGFCDGIGFVFFGDDPYCGIDLDHVWQSDADEGAEWATGILGRFADTYGEESPSTRGYKIWCRAKAPRCGKWPIGAGAIEIYDRARFFTVTGRSNGVLVVADHADDILALVENLDQDGANPASSARVISDTVPQGQRHNTLVSLAGTMWRRGMPAEAIEAALLATNAKVCDPPYPVNHIHQIVASMQRWER